MSVRRLFIDPGSISSGWALFVGSTLISSGTVASQQEDTGDADAFRRLALIVGRYGALAQELIDEVHFEQLVTKTHHYTHWSVGAIGAFFAAVGKDVEVTADVSISSWQRYCGWQKLKDKPVNLEDIEIKLPALRSLQERRRVASVDELAACGLGFFWVKEGCRRKKLVKGAK